MGFSPKNTSLPYHADSKYFEPVLSAALEKEQYAAGMQTNSVVMAITPTAITVAEGGPYTKINDSLLPAKGDTATGASYCYLDIAPIDPNPTCYDRLEDLDLSGGSTFHGSISTRFDIASGPGRYWLYLPIIFKFLRSSSNPNDTLSPILFK